MDGTMDVSTKLCGWQVAEPEGVTERVEKTKLEASMVVWYGGK